MVSPGDTAPDFTLEGAEDGEIRTFTLSAEIADRPAVLAFYIYDFSPVCTDQMCEMNDMEFLTFSDNVAAFGISTDGPYSHREFARANDLTYPLLTDDDRTVYEQYGMYTETDGERELSRGIVDSDRTVRYTWVPLDTWDGWDATPLSEATEVVRDLVA